MRALQRLVRNGNSTTITIPRVMLVSIGWLPGEYVVLELLDDHSVRVRRPEERDIAPLGKPRMLAEAPSTAAPK